MYKIGLLFENLNNVDEFINTDPPNSTQLKFNKRSKFRDISVIVNSLQKHFLSNTGRTKHRIRHQNKL